MELHGYASTVVLLRDGADGLETLLLQRPSRRGSFAGAWVFPGGLVDPEDHAPQPDGAAPATEPLAAGGSADAATDASTDAATAAAVRRAGVRETEEETGLLLDPAALVPLSCWIPPAEVPRRYRTWFFLAPAPEGRVRLSPDEHVDSAWLTPAEALDRHRRAEIELVTPTWVTLHHLAAFGSAEEALRAAAAAAPETFISRQHPGEAPGTAMVIWQDDAAYPGGQGAAPAARHRLVMDGRNWTYERTPA